MNVTPVDRERGWALFFWRKKKVQEALPDDNPVDETAVKVEAARVAAREALAVSEVASDKALKALRAGSPPDSEEVKEAAKAMRAADEAVTEWVRLAGWTNL